MGGDRQTARPTKFSEHPESSRPTGPKVPILPTPPTAGDVFKPQATAAAPMLGNYPQPCPLDPRVGRVSDVTSKTLPGKELWVFVRCAVWPPQSLGSGRSALLVVTPGRKNWETDDLRPDVLLCQQW